jgi:hypothetical protein
MMIASPFTSQNWGKNNLKIAKSIAKSGEIILWMITTSATSEKKLKKKNTPASSPLGNVRLGRVSGLGFAP